MRPLLFGRHGSRGGAYVHSTSGEGKDHIKEFLPMEYQDAEVTVKEVVKHTDRADYFERWKPYGSHNLSGAVLGGS